MKNVQRGCDDDVGCPKFNDPNQDEITKSSVRKRSRRNSKASMPEFVQQQKEEEKKEEEKLELPYYENNAFNDGIRESYHNTKKSVTFQLDDLKDFTDSVVDSNGKRNASD